MIRFASRIDRGVTIRFPEKPPAEILAILKGAGFRWQRFDASWYRRSIHGAADFLLALERRCNPGRPDGACWDCKAPDGFFRPYGAATPVYCDECHNARVYWESLSKEERERWGKLSQGAELPAFKLAYTNRPRPDTSDRSDLDYEDECARACGLI